MDSDENYTTRSARAAAERDELEDWVARFLSSPGSDNAPLAHTLTEQPRWWVGPVELPLDQLHRLAGPPGAPVLQVLEDTEWRNDVDDLAQQIKRGLDPAPVIVTRRGEQLVLEDGNHRVEALRRAGVDLAWSIVGFDSPEERDDFIERADVERHSVR